MPARPGRSEVRSRKRRMDVGCQEMQVVRANPHAWIGYFHTPVDSV